MCILIFILENTHLIKLNPKTQTCVNLTEFKNDTLLGAVDFVPHHLYSNMHLIIV